MNSFVSASDLKAWLHDGGEIALLDVREHGQYGESHLFYAIPLPYSRLEIDMPRLVPRQDVRVVVYDSGEDSPDSVALRAANHLRELGYSRVSVLDGGTKAWQAAGYVLFAGVNLPSKSFGELAELHYHTPRVSAPELAEMIAGPKPVTVLDGRPFSEFQKMNIPTATSCPNGELAWRIKSLVPDDHTPIVINCAGRTRSIIGAQTLINLGIPNPVYALENGTQGWFLADQTLEHGGTRRYDNNSGQPILRESAQRLAQKNQVPFVDTATVLAWQQDRSRSLYLCDVRSPEEFRAGTLPGAQHTPGGQLIQAFDQYIGIRGARLVLFDSDGVRAPTVASWLRQMGHDACVLMDGIQSGLSLPIAPSPQAPALDHISAASLSDLLFRNEAIVIDLRPSMDYRKSHIPGSQWSIRPQIGHLALTPGKLIVLLAAKPGIAEWTSTELPPGSRVALLDGGMDAWRAAGLPEESSPDTPRDAQCIDFLFFVHDRHNGNKEAARQYLAWETGLVAQLDAQELAAFRLPTREASHSNSK